MQIFKVNIFRNPTISANNTNAVKQQQIRNLSVDKTCFGTLYPKVEPETIKLVEAIDSLINSKKQHLIQKLNISTNNFIMNKNQIMKQVKITLKNFKKQNPELTLDKKQLMSKIEQHIKANKNKENAALEEKTFNLTMGVKGQSEKYNIIFNQLDKTMGDTHQLQVKSKDEKIEIIINDLFGSNEMSVYKDNITYPHLFSTPESRSKLNQDVRDYLSILNKE